MNIFVTKYILVQLLHAVTKLQYDRLARTFLLFSNGDVMFFISMICLASMSSLLIKSTSRYYDCSFKIEHEL